MPRIPYVSADLKGPIPDAIRVRRGDRGLTALDRSLLQAPSVAEGWNKLLGAIRTGSSLADDLREIMILRVAVRNRASYEWVQHAPVATKAGVTDGQLSTIGDVFNVLDAKLKQPLSPIQQAAVALADDMTQYIHVRDQTFDTLRKLLAESKGEENSNKEMTEAILTVATYNMVSRFLVATDVADHANKPCPVPGLTNEQGDSSSAKTTYPLIRFDYSHGLVQVAGQVQLATKVHFHSMQAPWIVFVNSLMTNLTMWDDVLPSFAAHYNIVTFDQRGHGASSVPPKDCTLDELADDVASVMDALGIERAHAVVGVSQGGATALNFAVRHGKKRADRVIACDTQPASPQANIAAWDERKALARKEGMSALADATVPRWFVAGQSRASDLVRAQTWQRVASTPVEGFAKSASALQGYDLLSKGLERALTEQGLQTLLVAGSADGKLPETLKAFSDMLNSDSVSFVEIPDAGHLPMCDRPELFVQAVLPWLQGR
jgi:pimeloyl-ACP methyl ester carboxylesterase/alkylhydroperoxidase family enzyme